jgi:manganese/iron transport system ATP-binding protein
MKQILKEYPNPAFPIHHVHHEADTPILEVVHLNLRYETGQVLDDLTFHLHKGERVAVVGPNGAGKSTLFKVIAGILPPTSGEVNVYGHWPGGHNCIAYVPQRSQVDWSFPASVTDVVMMGRVGKVGLLRWPRRRDWEHVQQALDEVDLTDLSTRQIAALSGGQQQRMFIARALAQEAELMLMDEPLTGLDVSSQENIFMILDRLRQHGVTVMVATHDLDQAAARFDRVMLLNRRILSFGAPEQVITTEHLRAAYGKHLHMLPGSEGVLALADTCCEEGEDG